MRVSVEKVEGVSAVAVSLNDGEVRIILEEENAVTIDRIREVIRDQGFTPRGASVRMRGIPERRGDRLVLTIKGRQHGLQMDGDEDVLEQVEARLGTTLVVHGEFDVDMSSGLRVTWVEEQSLP